MVIDHLRYVLGSHPPSKGRVSGLATPLDPIFAGENGIVDLPSLHGVTWGPPLEMALLTWVTGAITPISGVISLLI